MFAVSLPRPALLCSLFLTEAILIAVVYQLLVSVECRASGAELWCDELRALLGRGITVAAALGLYFVARPQAGADLLQRQRETGGIWPLVHALGVAMIFAPAVIFGADTLQAHLEASLPLMAAGALTAALGGAFWIVAPRDWTGWFAQQRGAPIWLMLAAGLLPELAVLFGLLWQWDWLARPTFQAVALVLSVLGLPVEVDVSTYVIGADDFYAQIAAACSGVEGLALVTGFIAIYAVLFRATLRQRRVWFALFPLALGMSWIFNVIRIALLITIGIGGSPGLAVNGFHSYAGWLAFTILALTILAGAQSLPWLHRGQARAPGALPLAQDWDAARILPFVVFMISGIVVSAFWSSPEAGYPLRMAAMMLSLIMFHRLYARLAWHPDRVALAAGGIVGLGWILAGVVSGAQATIADLAGPVTGAALALWVVARLVGTVVLVPLIEELFFRGYLLVRIDDGRLWRRALAIGLSSAGFALLHGQWLAAGLAGLVFAALMIRRGRVGDAVATHVTANAVVALWAAGSGNWALI